MTTRIRYDAFNKYYTAEQRTTWLQKLKSMPQFAILQPAAVTQLAPRSMQALLSKSLQHRRTLRLP